MSRRLLAAEALALVALVVAVVAPAGARTLAVCEDGADNDGDGLVDQADMGCAGQFDYSEEVTTPKQDAEYNAEAFLAAEFSPTSGDRAFCRRSRSGWVCVGRFRERGRWPHSVRLTLPRNFDGARYRILRYRARCGDLQPVGAGVYDVTTVNVRCKPARRLARHLFFGGVVCFRVCRVWGYRCVFRSTGYEVGRGKCTRRGRIVRFAYGA